MASKAIQEELFDQLFAELHGFGAHLSSPAFRSVDEFKSVLGTHVGHRRTRNEDRVALAHIGLPDQTQYLVAIACDGVGGSSRGDEAAAMAIASVICWIVQTEKYLSPGVIADSAMRFADTRLQDLLRGEGATTMSLFIASNRNEQAISNVGDSRVYSWAPFNDLIQISEDDTLENELKQLHVENRSFLKERGWEKSLSQAIGEIGRPSSDLKIKVLDRKQIPPGGILLGSDGIWASGELPFLSIGKNCQRPNDLVRRSITAASWLGGVDNASAIAIEDTDRITFPPHPPRSLVIWTPDEKILFSAPPARATPLKAKETPPPKERKIALKKQKRQKSKTALAATPELDLEQRSNKTKPSDIQAGPDED